MTVVGGCQGHGLRFYSSWYWQVAKAELVIGITLVYRINYQSRIRDTDTTTVAGDATYATDVCSKKKLRANAHANHIIYILTF